MKNMEIILNLIMPDEYSESEFINDIQIIVNKYYGELIFSSQKSINEKCCYYKENSCMFKYSDFCCPYWYENGQCKVNGETK